LGYNPKELRRDRGRRSGAWRPAAKGRGAPMNNVTPYDLLILAGGFVVIKLLMRDSTLGGNVLFYMIFLAGFVGWKLYADI
jgi:hypothetical protein